MKLGAMRRRHHVMRELRVLVVPIVVAMLLQSIVYSAVMIRGGREDWPNFLVTIAVLALVPVVTAALLASMRQQEFPLTVPAVITVIIYNFAVAGLSAFRVPVSYVGLLLAAIPCVVTMVDANIQLRRALSEHTGILDFPEAAKVREKLEREPTIIESPQHDLDGMDRLLIDGNNHHAAKWSPFITRALMIGIEVTPWQKYLEMRLRRVDVDNFDLTHLSYSTSQIWYSRAKRIIDFGAAIVLAPVVLPICGLVAAYIWMLDGSPVIFRQQRRGYGGSTFTLYKFRTMYLNSGDLQVQENDARILPGARYIRLFRLDELPQIVNILRGEMSWIGPRPAAVPIAEEIETSLPQYSHRHLVLPGLTGWAQVSHKYASNSAEEIEKLSYDLYYIKQLSFDLDLLILLKTIRILLTRHGAQ